MTKHTINIQDGYLFQNLKAGTPVEVELVTGRSVKGSLKRFDRFSLIVEEEGREHLIYKHAIATISEAAGDA